jgi:hypothetical protein
MGDIKKKIVVESDTEKYVLSSTGYAPEDETAPGDDYIDGGDGQRFAVWRGARGYCSGRCGQPA